MENHTEEVLIEIKNLQKRGVTNEKSLVEQSILSVVNVLGDGFVDSFRLSKHLIGFRNRDADPRQTTDYVQFLLREAPHVCRYTLGEGQYRVHEAITCSDACKVSETRIKIPVIHHKICPSCFITAAIFVSECEFCGEPLDTVPVLGV